MPVLVGEQRFTPTFDQARPDLGGQRVNMRLKSLPNLPLGQ